MGGLKADLIRLSHQSNVKNEGATFYYCWCSLVTNIITFILLYFIICSISSSISEGAAQKRNFLTLTSAKVHTIGEFMYFWILEKTLFVNFLAVGQGEAHIIECEMSRNGKPEYEYAIVDMGSSSIDRNTVDRMNRLVKNGKVSTIFFTHPDEDHYNYLTHFVKYFNYKIPNIYLGGSKELWNARGSKSKDFIDELKKSSNSLNYKTVSMFRNGNTQKVNLCEGLMTMEIIYGGHNRLD